VGSPPTTQHLPRSACDEDLGEAGVGGHGGEAHPLLDISHAAARGGPPGDGWRQPWWSSSSPSHLSAQHSAIAAKEKKFGAAHTREKKLRPAHGEWVSGHGTPYLGALILEVQNGSSATVSFMTNFEYLGSTLR
jgi:hypothetical protein